jgi:hypothetical protein
LAGAQVPTAPEPLPVKDLVEADLWDQLPADLADLLIPTCVLTGKPEMREGGQRTQRAIRRRSTHGKELPAALLSKVQMLMPLQRL